MPAASPARFRLVVTDLDDTLLDPSARVTDFTRNALRRAQDAGVHVVLSSGRALDSMRPFVEAIGATSPYIACNGAQIVDSRTHQPLSSLCFTPPEALALIRFVQRHGMYVHAYRGADVCYDRECDYNATYRRSARLNGVKLDSFETGLDFDTPKLLCIGEPEEVAALYPLVREAFAGRAVCTISKPIFLELAPVGADKGLALARLCDMLGVPLSETLAFGDSLNDLPMLRAAGRSVAVANARAEVRAAADDVCLGNDADGPARYILAHVLRPTERAPADA